MPEMQDGVGAGRDARQGEVGINVGAARRPLGRRRKMMSHVLGFGLGMTELLLLLGVVLLVFGGTRLPQLAKGLGSSIREFKKGAAGMDEAATLGDATGRADRRLD